MDDSRASIEDLGVAARGDQWMDWRVAILPDGREGYVGVLARGGFLLFDTDTGASTEVRPDPPTDVAWSFCQTPDRSCWHAEFGGRRPGRLYRWDGHGHRSRAVAGLPIRNVMSIAAMNAHHLIMGSATESALWMIDTRTLRSQAWCRWSGGGGAKVILRGADGWIYLLTGSGMHERIWAVRENVEPTPILDVPLSRAILWHDVLRQDASGQVWAQEPGTSRVWRLSHGRAEALVRPADAMQALDVWPSVGVAAHGSSIARLSNGARLLSVRDQLVRWRDAQGRERTGLLQRTPMPLRIFSVHAHGDHVWGGTFIPLTLFRYDALTGNRHSLGNPTQSSSGEIYRIVCSAGRLFMGSYGNASITCYRPDASHAPERSWRAGTGAESNPRELGLVGTQPVVNRPRAATVDGDGAVYFGAWDTKGRGRHSAIARVTPTKFAIERWDLPAIELSALEALPRRGHLLACWRDERDEQVMAGVLDFPRRHVITQLPLAQDRGSITATLPMPDGSFVLLHDYRAELLRLDVRSMRIVHRTTVANLGDHCQQALAWDAMGQRILGLTNQCVFSTRGDLSAPAVLAEYADEAEGNFYRFGLTSGLGEARGSGDRPSVNHWYFANGTRLMCLRIGRGG